MEPLVVRITFFFVICSLVFVPPLTFAASVTTEPAINVNVTYSNNNLTTAASEESNANCTGNGEQYCPETGTCSKPFFQCNGCGRFSKKCPDGRCVSIVSHILAGCSKCGYGMMECPNGLCYAKHYMDVCPACLYAQTRCSDGMCVSDGEKCSYCPARQHRCANKECIPDGQQCGRPCFDGQVYCKSWGSCEDNYQDCDKYGASSSVCSTGYNDMVLCDDGSCKYKSCNEDEEEEEDSAWNHMFLIAAVGLLLLVPVCCIYLCKDSKKPQGQGVATGQAVELQPLTSSQRPHSNVPVPAAQFVPQLPPQTARVPDPSRPPPAPDSNPNLPVGALNLDRVTGQPDSLPPPDLPLDAPPSYEVATAPPPAYDEVVHVDELSGPSNNTPTPNEQNRV